MYRNYNSSANLHNAATRVVNRIYMLSQIPDQDLISRTRSVEINQDLISRTRSVVINQDLISRTRSVVINQDLISST